jgi:hypothetical protein
VGKVMRGLRRWGVPWPGVLVVVALMLPQVVSNAFVIDIFIRVLLFAFIGVAWNLMGGYAKQLSLGHAAYFGLGAYTSTILEIRFDVSPWIGIFAGGVVAMAASLPIGALCFRLRGPYFAIATIATAQVPGFRVGRGGYDPAQPRKLAVDDAVRCEGRVLLHRIRHVGDRLGNHLLGRAIVDGILPGRRRRG